MPTKAPTKLGPAGGKLWRSITGSYELRPDEIRVLEDACREADLIDRLEDALSTADLIVHGSQGQPVANPLVQEVRQHRATFAGLLGRLKLPDEAAAEKAANRSSSARAAAQARWRRGA